MNQTRQTEPKQLFLSLLNRHHHGDADLCVRRRLQNLRSFLRRKLRCKKEFTKVKNALSSGRHQSNIFSFFKRSIIILAKSIEVPYNSRPVIKQFA